MGTGAESLSSCCLKVICKATHCQVRLMQCKTLHLDSCCSELYADCGEQVRVYVFQDGLPVAPCATMQAAEQLHAQGCTVCSIVWCHSITHSSAAVILTLA
jgi:hypothetical protein